MIIEVNKLKKTYGDKVVLNNLNLIIQEPCVYGLVGKNGVGKTTLLNIISGLSSATSGECFLFDKKVCKGQYCPGMLSYLPDLPNFFDYLTVKEYVDFILSGSGKRLDSIRMKGIEDQYHELGLKGKEKIKSLSRGNKQKLGIFTAVITEPRILILDEPTSALDPLGRRDVMSLIRELRNKGMTILFSTHILSDLEMVCDRIGFLHKGTIQKEIDMNVDASKNLCFEITVETKQSDKCKDIQSALTAFNVIQLDANKLRVESNGEAFNQKYLLSILSELNVGIISIKRVAQRDLDAIMMEVLSQ